MDIRNLRFKVLEFVKKYRYVMLVLLIGIGLMAIPDSSGKKTVKEETAQVQTVFPDPTSELTQILKQIRGVGEVKLMLTVDTGTKTIYQVDQQTSSGTDNTSVRLETVIVTDSQRADQGLIQQIVAPQFRGAVVVCQGADDAAVRLSVVEAVSDATGLSTDKISVVKMK